MFLYTSTLFYIMVYKKIVKILKKHLPPKIFNILLFIKNIPLNITSFYLEQKYKFLSKYSIIYGITRKKRKIPVIMSNTTFPARINKVYLSIETILRQSIKPDYIYLWLANDEFPKGKISLPKNLLELEKRGLQIRFTNNNLRSNNKLFHTLKENQNAIIITFDDDCFYDKDYIKNLLIAHKKFPNDIIGYDSMQIKIDKSGMPLKYDYWFNYDKNKVAGKDIFLLSVNGILYPPKCFSREALNDKILKRVSLYNDDIWFKAMALLSGRDHRRVFRKNKKYLSVLDTQQFGLNNVNVAQNRNDKILNNIFKEYKLNRFFKKMN